MTEISAPMESRNNPAIALPVGKILYSAFAIPWRDRREMLSALALPALVLIIIDVSDHYLDGLAGLGVRLFLGFASLAPFTIFAVTCHRLLLMRDADLTSGIKWTGRETGFFGWLVVLWLVSLVFFAFAYFVLTAFREASPYWLGFVLITTAIAAMYLLARVCLIFPATAIDLRPKLHGVWQMSRCNGWRLVITTGILPLVLSLIMGPFLREGASLVEIILVELLAFALLVVEIAALSFSYRELSYREFSQSTGEERYA